MSVTRRYVTAGVGYGSSVFAVANTTHRATFGRSVRLFRAFLAEQSDPAHFYTTLAADSASQVAEYCALRGARMLDVGGGPGYFRRAFEDAGATYVALDSDVGELSARGAVEPGSVIGDAMAMPFADGVFDVCYSSNVLEHVPRPWDMAAEMLRVTAAGGTVFLSFTCWYGWWGGHETSPWHFLGGESAARRYERRHGRPPKNRYGRSLFPVTVRDALAWARATPHGDLVAAFPRYHPGWCRWIGRVPVLREVATWNLVLVLRRR